MAAKIILSDDQLSSIINDYICGKSTLKIAKELGRSAEYIRLILKENDVKIKDFSEINKKYNINENFFDHIDSEDKAYFLGMLFSDGNVSKSSNSITLKLHNKDIDILNKLSKLIGKEYLYYSDNNAILKFSSKNIKEKLINYGCIPNKSLILKYPDIEKSLNKHFIRGYFDGDGSISKSKNNNYHVSIISTNDFCNSVKNIIKNETGLIGSISPLRESKITGVLTYGGNRRVKQLLDWLYDGNLYMDRKFNRYLELNEWISYVNNKYIINDEIVNDIFIDKANGISYRKLRSKYNLPINRIRKLFV